MESNNEQIIEHLRAEMIQLYEQIGDFTDPRVVGKSQQLDEYLVDAQRQRLSRDDVSRTAIKVQDEIDHLHRP